MDYKRVCSAEICFGFSFFSLVCGPPFKVWPCEGAKNQDAGNRKDFPKSEKPVRMVLLSVLTVRCYFRKQVCC